MRIYYLAILTGLLGSFHCIGMCGPLAFSLPHFSKAWSGILMEKIIYNFGRIFTYSLLGLLVGLIGRRLWLIGIQSSLSIGIGLVLIGIASLKILAIRLKANGLVFGIPHLNNLLSWALKNQWGLFWIGIINGLLPCGFVFIALLSALNTQSAFQSSLYMFYFGMGTFPMMLLTSYSLGFIKIGLRRKINQAIPFIILLMGCWFLLRGMSLNIPYLSPILGKDLSICH